MNNLNPVETTVLVAGQQLHFVSLNLHQKFYEHNRCEILVDHDAFGDKLWMANPVKMFNLVGESVSITMVHKMTFETNTFIGIVSNISFVGGKGGAQNFILIEGVSDTIRLSGKPTMDSFVNKTLENIVNEAVGTSGNGASVTVKSDYSKPIDYIAQYNESCFDFLNRLCYLYGESFWNDGTTTYWGKPDPDDIVMLSYDREMTDFNLRASLLPPKFKDYNYMVHDDEERFKSTRGDVPEATGYLIPILEKSESIYVSDATKPLDASVGDTDSILRMVDIERTRTIADMLVLSGRTQTCKVKIGNGVLVDFPDYMNVDTSAGVFIVTEVDHEVDQEGHYSNTFSGVRAALGNVPMPPIPLPTAASQRATVLSNADPANRGRIQVQYQWQKLVGKNTNWISVQTPDGGSSDKVASNRGLVTIPETGDNVMINFEYGDPNRPYCAGSIFTSKVGGGGGQGNKTKSLTTRSGSTVSLDDSTGSVTISDQAGSTSKIVLDGSKNITVDAGISITINIGTDQCIFKMTEDGKISIDAETEIKLCVGKTNTLTMTPTDTTLETPTKIDLTAPTIHENGSKEILLKKDGSNKVTISGSVVDIDGGQVQIN